MQSRFVMPLWNIWTLPHFKRIY